MRVLVLTSLFPERPGEKNGNFIHAQVCAVARCGASVDVLFAQSWRPRLTFLSGNKRRASSDGSPLFRLHRAQFISFPRYVLGRAANWIAALFLCRRISAIATERGIDLIHAHDHKMAYVAIIVGRRLGIPVIVTLHGINTAGRLLNSAAKRAQLSATLSGAARVVLVGSPIGAFYEQFVSRSSLEIVSNGFHLPATVSPSNRIPRRFKTRIVTVTNLHSTKGVDYLLRSIAELVFDNNSEVELVIVGSGPERNNLLHLARDLGIEHQVSFTGELLHADAIAEIGAGDIFCLPSWLESCGLVYMEAMALGKPTIGCRGQGAADLISHGLTGYLVEPRSTGALTDIFLKIIANPLDAERIAQRGKDHAWRDLTWDQSTRKLMHVYESALGAFSADGSARGQRKHR